MPTQGGRGCFVIAGAVVTLGLGLSEHSCCSAVEGMLGKGDWLARKVRNVLPELWAPSQMLIMTAWGCQRPCHPMEGSGGDAGGRGERNRKGDRV